MKLTINNEVYEVIIEKKKIKNTYIRVKKDLKIYITTNIFTTDTYIKKLINEEYKQIEKMINLQKKKLEKEKTFTYLGNPYQVVVTNAVNRPMLDSGYLYVKNAKDAQPFLTKEARTFLPERLKTIHKSMNNPKIPLPIVKIRKMTRKWGYNKKSENLVVLNSDLIKCAIDDIDYVIIHELCHFLHFNHSVSFWQSVEYYKPNYKENKKSLKEE